MPLLLKVLKFKMDEGKMLKNNNDKKFKSDEAVRLRSDIPVSVTLYVAEPRQNKK